MAWPRRRKAPQQRSASVSRPRESSSGETPSSLLRWTRALWAPSATALRWVAVPVHAPTRRGAAGSRMLRWVVSMCSRAAQGFSGANVTLWIVLALQLDRPHVDKLRSAPGPVAVRRHSLRANMIGYVTVTIPPSGAGNARSRKTATTQAITWRSGMLASGGGCFAATWGLLQPNASGGASSAFMTALTCPSRLITK